MLVASLTVVDIIVALLMIAGAAAAAAMHDVEGQERLCLERHAALDALPMRVACTNAVRSAVAADACFAVFLPWLLMAAGMLSSNAAAVAAPSLLWAFTAIAIRSATALWPAGAWVVVPPYALAAQAMRCASLMARASPSPGWSDTAFVLLETAAVVNSLFLVTLGIEIPAWATFMGLRQAKEPPGLVPREAGYLFTLVEEVAGKGGKEE